MKKPHTTRNERCLSTGLITPETSGLKKSIFFPLVTFFIKLNHPGKFHPYQPFICTMPAITGVPAEIVTENIVQSEKSNDQSAGSSILRSLIFFDWKDHG